MTRLPRQTGFTLLEILVVVTLIAGIAAFVMPALLGSNPGKVRDQQAEELSRLLTLASDYSLFRGQLVAMVLESDRVTPVVFDLEEQDFRAADDQALQPLLLEEPLQLEWELETAGNEEATLGQAALARREQSSSSTGLTTEADGDEEADALEQDPQLFFFPSGEATPAMLIIRHPDLADQRRLSLDAMGRTTDPDAPEEEHDEQDQLR